MKELKTTDAQRRAAMKWQAANYVRVPLDLRPADRDELREAATAAGMTVGGYIKAAIREKMEKDRMGAK